MVQWESYWRDRIASAPDCATASGRSGHGADDCDALAADAARYMCERALPATPILDLGCGPGRVARLLRRAARKVVAVDISHEAVRMSAPGAVARGAALPFLADIFGGVYVGSVVQYLSEEDGRALFAECCRVACAGAPLLLQSVPDALYRESYLRGCPDEETRARNAAATWWDAGALREALWSSGWAFPLCSPMPEVWESWYAKDWTAVRP